MAKTATLAITYSLSGDGWAGVSLSASVGANANAAPPSTIILAAGNNPVPWPAGVTVNGVLLIPPTGSTNAKSVKAASGDSNPGNWESGPFVYPLFNATTFIINSVGIEAIQAVWF